MLWKKLAVSALWCLCVEFAYSVQPYVFGRMDLATGRIPSAMVASDFNRDGATDFAVVNTADNTVSVFLGKSDHTFTRTDYTVGPGPVSIAVADFNSDGQPDLVVANQNCNNTCGPGSVSILLNKGDGTFLNAVSYGTGMKDALAVVVADFNGDGEPDLAVANGTYGYAGPGTVSVFLNQGNGTFRHKGDYPAGVGIGGLVAFAPGGNGSPSLAITNFTALNGVNAIVILRGAGDGSFKGPVNSYPTGLGPRGIVTADFNGDGNPDLAVANGAGNTVSVFLGRPDGTFADKVDLPVTVAPNRVTVGDLNGDHKMDLIVSAGTSEPGGGAVSVLLGKGDGTFLPYVQYITGNDPISIVAADFNGDGYPDVAFTNGDVYRVSILLGKGDGRFPTATNSSAGSLPIAIAGADVNGDGRPDLIVANAGDNTISVFLNNGGGIFVLAHTYSVGREPKGIAVGDLNGDHKPDLVVTNAGDNTISILLGNGDGTFTLAHTYSAGAAPYGVVVSDLNGDRMPDVVVANTGDDTISVLLGNGDGTLQPQTTYVVGAGPSSVAIADFNGDGMPDLAVSDSETPTKIGNPGLVSVLLNKGNGTFGNKTDYAAGYNPQSVVAVDLNGDGKPDLALATNLDTFGFVAVLIGNGDGTFQPQTTYQEGFAIYSLAVGDFNSDGFADLVVTSSQNSSVFVMAGDGHGRFHVQGTYGTGEAPVSLAVGNFVPKSQPGGPDLAVANFYSNSISVFNNSQLQQHPVWTGAPDYPRSFKHPEE